MRATCNSGCARATYRARDVVYFLCTLNGIRGGFLSRPPAVHGTEIPHALHFSSSPQRRNQPGGSRSPEWCIEDVAGGDPEASIRSTQGKCGAAKEATNGVLGRSIEGGTRAHTKTTQPVIGRVAEVHRRWRGMSRTEHRRDQQHAPQAHRKTSKAKGKLSVKQERRGGEFGGNGW